MSNISAADPPVLLGQFQHCLPQSAIGWRQFVWVSQK